MTIKVTYNVTDVYMSQSVSPVYINVSYSDGGASGGGVWGSITGTLSNQTDLQTALDLKLDESTIDGGTEGQILSKASATDFDFAWINNYAKYLATNVRNQTGSTIGAFQVVYISGATGNKPLVSLADADTEATSSKTYGVTATSIANNSTGDVVTAGELSGIDTSAFNEGDLLWLSTTAGGVVTTPPAEPAHAVFIGYVVRSHPTLGTIDVSIQNGYELNELHGVQITTPTDNQGLFYNSTSTLWENKSITTALGYTPVPTTRNITINGVTYDLSADRTWTIAAGISGSGASGQVTYWTGASAVSGSNNLFWDNSNSRLGIGTNAPAVQFHLNTTTAGNNFRISGANNTSVNFTTDTDGRSFLNVNGNTSATANAGAYFTAQGFQEAWFNVIANGANSGNKLWRFGNIGVGTLNNVFAIQKLNDAGTAISSTPFVINSTNGFIGINNTAPSVQLSVIGDTLLRGSGNTSATTALTVQNSSSTDMFRVRNDGFTFTNFGSYIGSSNNNVILSTDASGTSSASGLNLRLLFGAFSTAGYGLSILGFNSQTRTATSGESGVLLLSHGFAPTSGTGTFTGLAYNGTINQTGGANGITRGLYVNPTLTAAADFRAIEWSNNSGWGLYGAGTANNYLSGSLLIGTTNNFAKLYVAGPNVSGTTQTYIGSQPTINQPLTNLQCFWSNIVGNLASTVTNAHNYIASQSGIASSTITNLFGFTADSSLSTATNVYGFYGNIASGSGRWNLYMNGTADNYLAGDLGIGTTSVTNWLNIGASTTAKAHMNLASGVAPTSPANGDIWFDGTDIKMRIGGVTKTFTLI